MNVYEPLGVEAAINLAGAMTRYGGACVRATTLAAMNDAARHSVRLDQLQATASKTIARRTHSEAGIVTCGASAALTLATAACITGFDVAKMNRLPNTSGMPNEVIMPWHQISGYDHSITLAGATIIGAGIPNDTSEPEAVHTIDPREVEAEITDKTVAIAYAARPNAHPSLIDIVHVAHKHNLPVIVDAAAEVPPVANLHTFIDEGADLVCISGGKGIRGPQASGLLCGRRDLVGSALLQMLDLAGERFPEWDPPEALIDKSQLCGKPLHGIGRGMKVTKEAIVGLLVALENFTEESFIEDERVLTQGLQSIASALHDIPGIAATLLKGRGYPVLELRLRQQCQGPTAREVVTRLRALHPAILVEDCCVEEDRLFLNSLNLREYQMDVIIERLVVALLP